MAPLSPTRGDEPSPARRCRSMRKDALAGVRTAAVVIPQSMADATIAGLPVESVCTRRSCRCCSGSSPTSSPPVLAGFKAGTGLLIAVGQLGKVLGIEQTGDEVVAWLARD